MSPAGEVGDGRFGTAQGRRPMFARALRIWAMTTALAAAAAATGAAAQGAPSSNRLALVVGEAAYSGDALPTASADAAAIARSLAGYGFDVTELHDLVTADLAQQYQTFLAKVAAAPPGAAVMVYFAGLGVNVGCDDYLLPVDAQIATEADAPRIALSMTRVMRDLAQTQSQVRFVALDGARPIPQSVSGVAFPRGLAPLDPPPATAFALSAEVHDFESPPKPGDVDDAYAAGLATVMQQPLPDLDTTLREARIVVHQTTGGAQTPWHAVNASTPPFAFVVADPAQAQAALSGLPNTGAALASLDATSAYWAAIWRNDVPDYQAYLAAFANVAPAELLSRVKQLLDLLSQLNPQCQAALPPPAPAPAAATCPEGFLPEDGYNAAYCLPLAPPPTLDCPLGFAMIAAPDGLGCAPLMPPPTLFCPPDFVVFGAPPYCAPRRPPIVCPPDFRPLIRDNRLACGHRGPPPPFCPPGSHPDWNGAAWACGGNPPPPPPCLNARPLWSDGHWGCVTPPPPRCPQGQFPHWSNGAEACGVVLRPLGALCPQGYAPGAGLCAQPTIVLSKRPPPPGPSPWRCLPGAPGCGPVGPNAPVLGKPPGGPGLTIHEHRGVPGGPPLQPLYRPQPHMNPPLRIAPVRPPRPACGGPGEPRCR
jgi:uncharacterized caspase-like protein